MRKFLLWSGWVAAFLLCVVAGMLYLWGSQQAEKANRLGIERSSQEAALNDLKKKMVEQAEPAETASSVQTTSASDAGVPSPVPENPAPPTSPVPPAATVAPAATVPTAAPVSPVPVPTPVAGGTAAPAPGGAPSIGAPAVGAPAAVAPDSSNISGPTTSPAITPQLPVSTNVMSAQALVNKYYDAYFKMAGLPKDIEQQVRGILQRYQEARQTLTRRFTQNELLVEEYARRFVTIRNQVRGDLGAILIPADLVVWNEYEMTLPERLMRQDLENALTTGVTTLSLAARAHIADVLLQEMLPIFEAQRNGLLPLELDHTTVARPMIEAYARARTRLAKDFSKEEMNQTILFFERQLSRISPVK